MRMVNKTRRDEVEVVQLCKGGCRDIPGLVPSSVRGKRGGWEVAGTIELMVRASTALSFCVAMLNATYVTL